MLFYLQQIIFFWKKLVIKGSGDSGQQVFHVLSPSISLTQMQFSITWTLESWLSRANQSYSRLLSVPEVHCDKLPFLPSTGTFFHLMSPAWSSYWTHTRTVLPLTRPVSNFPPHSHTAALGWGLERPLQPLDTSSEPRPPSLNTVDSHRLWGVTGEVQSPA